MTGHAWMQRVMEDAPATRVVDRGAAALSTMELLSLLCTGKTKKQSALDRAREFLGNAGSLRALFSKTVGELQNMGASEHEAARIQGVAELTRRFAEEDVRLAETLGGSEEAYRFLRPRLRDLPHEVFAVIFLNQKHGVIAYRELFRGTVCASSVHPREVVKAALENNAAAVILAHNHPSGHVSPSPDDLRITEELKGLLRHIDVRVIDHVIVGGNGYFSFAREGLLA